ncbi:MAG: S49 family peptidase [Xanthobacteraceae bacterium]
MTALLAHIADRVLNQPLLLTPEKLAVIAHFLEGRIEIDASELAAQFKAEGEDEVTKVLGSRYVGEFELSDPDNPRSARKPYRTTKQGAAIIPVHGSLVNRGGWLDAMSGLTSYEKLKFQVGEAAKDPAVQSILLDIDSPGGEAIGAFETADAIRLAGQSKPVIAVANGLCCSAAYALASGATKIVTSRSSVVGSIGTFILHLDRSKQLADMGVKPTLIAVGKRKGDGLPHFELSDEAKTELQSYAIRINNLFVSTVAANRPRTTADSILALEAGVFIGAEAIEHGLVDEVATLEEVLDYLARLAPRPAARPRIVSTR